MKMLNAEIESYVKVYGTNIYPWIEKMKRKPEILYPKFMSMLEPKFI